VEDRRRDVEQASPGDPAPLPNAGPREEEDAIGGLGAGAVIVVALEEVEAVVGAERRTS
jgi:hypothetical protein